jgi:hypothetical protein
MHTLYSVHVNASGQVAVDCNSDRRKTPNKWRVYFCVSASSLKRLRSLRAKYRRSFYVAREWSPLRWEMYRKWKIAQVDAMRETARVGSLDYLVTNSDGGAA